MRGHYTTWRSTRLTGAIRLVRMAPLGPGQAPPWLSSAQPVGAILWWIALSRYAPVMVKVRRLADGPT